MPCRAGSEQPKTRVESRRRTCPPVALCTCAASNNQIVRHWQVQELRLQTSCNEHTPHPKFIDHTDARARSPDINSRFDTRCITHLYFHTVFRDRGNLQLMPICGVVYKLDQLVLVGNKLLLIETSDDEHGKYALILRATQCDPLNPHYF